MAMIEKRAIKLDWQDVCTMVAAEIKNIIGVESVCKVKPMELEYWEITFGGCRLPLPKLCLLLQGVQASLGDWEDSLPGGGGNCGCRFRHGAVGETALAALEAYMGARLDSGRQLVAGGNIKIWR